MLMTAFSLAAVTAAQVGTNEPYLFENLPAGWIYHSCGCDFHRLSDSSGDSSGAVFTSDMERSARIQVGGKVITLPGQQLDTKCWPSQVGGRCVLKYANKDYRVVITVRATWVCPSGSGLSCVCLEW
jgi:hypothetical protein